METTAHQPMAAARPVVPQATGAAQRRRAQHKRSDARHVAWMASLLQAESSHHSGSKLASAIVVLQADVAQLRQRLEKYEALVCHAVDSLPGRESKTSEGFSTKTDDISLHPHPQPDPHLAEGVSLVQVPRPTVNALVARFEGRSSRIDDVPGDLVQESNHDLEVGSHIASGDIEMQDDQQAVLQDAKFDIHSQSVGTFDQDKASSGQSALQPSSPMYEDMQLQSVRTFAEPEPERSTPAHSMRPSSSMSSEFVPGSGSLLQSGKHFDFQSVQLPECLSQNPDVQSNLAPWAHEATVRLQESLGPGLGSFHARVDHDLHSSLRQHGVLFQPFPNAHRPIEPTVADVDTESLTQQGVQADPRPSPQLEPYQQAFIERMAKEAAARPAA